MSDEQRARARWSRRAPKLDEIEGRWSKATPGPWEIERDGVNRKVHSIGPIAGYDYDSTNFDPRDPDVAAIAAAPEDIAYLLRIARAAETMVSRCHPSGVQVVIQSDWDALRDALDMQEKP